MSKKSAVQAELEIIRKQHGGILDPKDVVKFAKNPKTALHAQFNWDDTEAAKQWRLHEARNIIRLHVTVISDENPHPVRAYVSLSTERHGSKAASTGYRHVADILSDEDLSIQMLSDALNELKTFQKKYRTLKALKPVWDAIEKVEVVAEKVKRAA